MPGWSRNSALVLALVVPSSLAGQDQVKTVSFTGDVAFVSTAGNTSVSTLNLGDRFVAQTPDKRLVFTQVLGIVYGRSEGEKNAENYRATIRLDHLVNHAVYAFGMAGWERNVFGGIARRFEETVGLAWRALRLPNDELTVEGGLSLVQQRNVVAANGVEDNFTAGRLAAAYKHLITGSAFVTQNLEFIPNFKNGTDWRLNSESAAIAPISTRIGIKLGYVIRYDNLPGLKPPPNPTLDRLEKTDRFFTAGLTISY